MRKASPACGIVLSRRSTRQGIDYRGVIYAGLMPPYRPTGVEFNCRFGDPECQT